VTTVNFGTSQLRTVGQQFVYLRQVWGDDWALADTIQCLDATWCLSPTMPTATLTRDYGHIKQLGSTQYDIYAKLDIVGWYVKVVFQTNPSASGSMAWDTKTWYGVVSHLEDENRGIVTYGEPLATGNQTWYCYGLEKLLDTEYLKESWVNIGNTTPLIVQLPITFNRGGQPNRSDLVMEPENSYVFEGRDIHDPSYPDRHAEFWSTYHIVDYLLSWATPKASFFSRNAMVPFMLPTADAMYLSTLDQPVIEQEGKTVLALLDRLVDRRRLRAFYLDVDETADPHDVRLRVVPWNQEIIDTGIEGADVLLQNENVRSLYYDYNQSTTALLRQSRVAKFDQVVVRGARRTSTATFHVGSQFLEPAWTGTEESAYEAAASGVAGYAGWDRLQQMQRNAEVRSSELLSSVFSWFRLPDDWPGTTLDTASAAAYYVFIGETVSTKSDQYIHDVVWEPYIPLYEHVDYSGTKIASETVTDAPINVYRQPKVFFKVPTDARWVAGDAIANLMESTGDADDAEGDGKNFRWSAHVRTQPDTRTLEVRVAGEQQHVIAKTDFSPLTAIDRQLGEFDYQSKKMFVTATLRDNRYAEGKYPEDDSVGDSSLIDCQFGYVIFAGDAYRQDYVVPTTVLDVATDGTFITTTGGYVRDDTDLLRALARVTYEWWNQDRNILTLTTTELTSAISIGDYIDTIGTAATGHRVAVNTVISQLRIAWPRLEGNSLGSPVMELTTGAGELDPMTMTPKLPEVMSRSKARVRR
jgi:hypothetical protein